MNLKITRKDIKSLQRAAAQAGDTLTVADCERALYSSRGKAARKRVEKIILEHRAEREYELSLHSRDEY